ncbi:hypothetical protein [Candidatus Albibeggiatoa sp. nov. BB20]|uniref:NACHT domain-containing protein n=1 Tax=Candidatus Albibeggiatoa sp. nov. BB20 TaxID=3162723 RepID=UPI00336554C9
MSGLAFFFLVTTIISIGFAAYFLYKSQAYTRERFAFAILGFISNSSLLIITTVFTQQFPFNILPNIANQFLGTSFELETALLAIFAIGAAILGIFCWTLVSIHKNWHGQISQHHYEVQQSGERINLLKDSYLFLTKDESLEQYNPVQDDVDVISSEPEAVQIIWKDHARELLSLRYPRKYQFEQWHEDGKYWRGKLQDEEKILIVACWQDLPINNEIKSFLQTIPDDADVIIVVRAGDFDKPRKLDNRRFRQISESKLLDSLIDISDYLRQIEQEVTQPLKFTDLSLQDMYTVSDYSLEKDGERQQDIEAYIKQWLDESSLRQLSVLGHYGMGKTSLSNMLTYKLLLCYRQGERVRIPILIRLRGKTLRTLSKQQVLDLFAGQYKVSRDALLKLLVAGRLLLIFEGFDELDLIGDKDMRRQYFKPLWDLSNYEQAKTLITGRPNFFFDDDELRAALRTYGSNFFNIYSEPVYLQPFSLDQIQVCLQPVPASTREGMLSLVRQDSKFREVVERPSMLYVTSTLWEKEKLSEYEGLINSAYVMDLYIKHSYRRDGVKQELDCGVILTNAERGYFMQGIAVYMAVHDLPNTINNFQLKKAVTLLVDAMPDAVSQLAEGDENRIVLKKRLQQRLQESRQQTISSIVTDVHTTALLEQDVTQSNAFQFGHKSFMEFLIAKTYADWMMQTKTMEKEHQIAQAIKNKLGLVKMDILKYQDTRTFFGQILIFHLQKTCVLKQEQLLKKLLIIMNFNKLLYWLNKPYLWVAILILEAQKKRVRMETKPENVSIYNYWLKIINTPISSYHFLVFLLTDILIYCIRLIKGKKRKFIISSFEKINPFLQKSFMGDMLIEYIVWYETCTALDIDRDTMAKVVGKRAMILFEDPPEKR